MEIRFWGVRGSIASSGSHVARIGGNTSCVEVSSGGHRLVFDAGTGIRNLGDVMMKGGKPASATLLFSHLHWDHVQGFPFFTPAYLPNNQFKLYGPGEGGGKRLYDALDRQMTPPGFPVPLTTMKSAMSFNEAKHLEKIETGPFVITPFWLNHPDGCLGYRVDADGRSFVYATDVELGLNDLDPKVAAAIEGVDALCLDGQYTPDEYSGKVGMARKGWGHSTMVDAAKVAFAVGAGRLFLFHHDPARTDEAVENMAEEARSYFKASEPARENKRILLDDETSRMCA